MGDNTRLAQAMDELGLSQGQMADALNSLVESFTGRPGRLTDRDIRRWLTGRTAWPHARQRRALEHLFSRPATALGFTPRGRSTPEDGPVNRRDFIAATAGAVSPVRDTRRHTIGATDVERFSARLRELHAEDDAVGASRSLESRAIALAADVVAFQQTGSASPRVRAQLYAVASQFAALAVWSAIDGRRTGHAKRHLDRTIILAGYSGDSTIQYHAWTHASMVGQQAERPMDALAATEAARACGITRQDPLYSSLAYVRTASAHSFGGDTTAAYRSLDRAQCALARADMSLPRPRWIDFYDQAELAGLTSTTYLRAGRAAEAEAHAHRALALLRPELHRNRAYYTAHLARTQLQQGEVELAIDTAERVLHGDTVVSARIAKLLDGFSRDLHAAAPKSLFAREWTARRRDGV